MKRRRHQLEGGSSPRASRGARRRLYRYVSTALLFAILGGLAPSDAAAQQDSKVFELTRYLAGAKSDPQNDQLAASAVDYLSRGAPADRDSAWLTLALCRYYQRSAHFKVSVEQGRAARDRFQRVDDPFGLANTFNSLGFLHKEIASYFRSENYYDVAIQMLAGSREPQNRRLYVQALNNRGKLAFVTGKYAEAQRFYDRAVRACDDLLAALSPAEHPLVLPNKGQVLNNLATLQYQQRRFDQAEVLYGDAEKIFLAGNDEISRIGLADVWENLGTLYRVQQKFPESGAKYEAALKLRRETSGSEHHHTARTTFQLGKLRMAEGKNDEALAHFDEAYRVRGNVLGPRHPDTGAVLIERAKLFRQQGKHDDAKRLLDEAIKIHDDVRAGSGERYQALLSRARLQWSLGRKAEAIQDIRAAMGHAERQREDAVGSEREMAAEFAEFRTAFELGIQWQLDNTAEVFSVMERSRSRALLDQILTNGLDPDHEWEKDAEPEAADKLSRLQGEVTDVKRALAAAEDRLVSTIQGQLTKLQGEVADLTARIRGDDSVLRKTIRGHEDNTRLSDLVHELKLADKLLLMYAVTGEQSYLLVVDGTAEPALYELNVDAEAALALGVPAGKLGRGELASCMRNADGRVALSLQSPQPAAAEDSVLHACYRTLIPEPVRKLLAAHPYRGLTVIPDGALGAIPFEALVVAHDIDNATRTYFIDVAPPIEYAPSVAVWRRLGERRVAKDQVAGVVTLGDPAYHLAGQPVDTQVVSRGAVRGQALPALPYSGVEADKVFQAFNTNAREPVTKLVGRDATEGRLRGCIEQKRIIHLACHGFVDDRFGNFFGHLALAPGASPAGAHDDGEVTLDEIYRLKLTGCEVAVLSACHTNSSPEQFSEGTWGLSHGFVVAGATRVVASNWLVDDQAASQLVVDYLSKVAAANAGGFRHAEALRNAKKALMKADPKFAAPYYWAPFVLLASD